jgi:hypothetical protein
MPDNCRVHIIRRICRGTGARAAAGARQLSYSRGFLGFSYKGFTLRSGEALLVF